MYEVGHMLDLESLVLSDGEPIQTHDAHTIHDRDMAAQQALVHRVLLTLDTILDNYGARTYIGDRVGDLADRIRSGNLEMYKAIQDNVYINGRVESFKAGLDSFSIEEAMKKRG